MRPDCSPSAPESQSPARITALDVLRGFALCGILLANIQAIAGGGDVVTGRAWLDLLVHQRFFPIFSLLFGIGFSLLLESAARRGARPRLLLLRRLLALLAIGLAHFVLLWRGEILTFYALAGLIVLLPSTWLPRWAVAALAAVLVATALLVGGFYTEVPALFLLGSALVRYGVIARIEDSARVPAVLALLFAAGAVPALWVQVGGANDHAVRFASVVGGLLLAGIYVCLILVLLRTPLRPLLHKVFTPLGRMALTNYLTATLLVLAAARLIGGRPHEWASTTVLLIAAVILIAQWSFSALWLSRFHQGPVEWLWRWATWAQRPPLSRSDP
ncbi:DUF418 domain-containing protein [Nonomuraea sp. CA-141351]|uniref:DUF418 domain-containing protein n=1 Tax=Nonomuraea sp. CA-141351 TaxID=3239996 RepID=UPI003D942A6D